MEIRNVDVQCRKPSAHAAHRYTVQFVRA